MANHRFETGKKKVNHLTFDDYSYCAVLMIANWSYSAIGNTGFQGVVVISSIFFSEILYRY